MPTYSVKVKDLQLPPQDGGQPESLAVKVKYTRGPAPAGGHELDGLFDYTKVLPALREAVLARTSDRLAAFSRDALRPELRAQGIPEGKEKQVIKPLAPAARAVRRAYDFVARGDVRAVINHGGIYRGPHRAAGDVTESLGYVVKLNAVGDKARAPGALDALREPGLAGEVRACFGLLRDGRALEVVNKNIVDVLRSRLGAEVFDACAYKVSIKRPQLLQDACVVIGESGLGSGLPAPRAAFGPGPQGPGPGHYARFDFAGPRGVMPQAPQAAPR